MRLDRLLTFAGYTVCAYLVAVPIVEGVAAMFPLELGVLSWRVSAMTLLTQAFMTPMLGLTLAGGLALLRGHRAAIAGLVLTTGTVSIVLFILCGFFLADAWTLREVVPAERGNAFALSAGLAAFKMAAVSLWAMTACVGGLGYLRRGAPHRDRADGPDSPGILFGGEGVRDEG